MKHLRLPRSNGGSPRGGADSSALSSPTSNATNSPESACTPQQSPTGSERAQQQQVGGGGSAVSAPASPTSTAASSPGRATGSSANSSRRATPQRAASPARSRSVDDANDVRVCVVGAAGSGKSALVRRFADDTFTRQRRSAPRSVRELVLPLAAGDASVRVSLQVVPDVESDMREALANADAVVLAVDPHDAYWLPAFERCAQTLQRVLETREGPYVGRTMKTYARPVLVALTKCDTRDVRTAEECDANAALRARLMHIVVPVVTANDELALRQPQIVLCSSALPLAGANSGVSELFTGAIALALDSKRWRRRHADTARGARPASPGAAERTALVPSLAVAAATAAACVAATPDASAASGARVRTQARSSAATQTHRVRTVSALGRQWRSGDSLHQVESDSIHALLYSTVADSELRTTPLAASSLSAGALNAVDSGTGAIQPLSRHSTGHTELEDTISVSSAAGTPPYESDEQCQIT
jgi:GTPase SAR1 family protein